MVKDLINGFTNFRKNFFSDGKGFYPNLVKKEQKPKAMVISCSDSRVDPAILFGALPGELFVVRNVANLVPPYQPDEGFHGVSAAIEYGVRDLGVKEIIVLGHAFCGGIEALCSNLSGESSKKREFIMPWVEIARPAVERIETKLEKSDMVRAVEQASIINSIKNLRTFPWVQSGELSNNLRVHGWWFEMEEGALWAVDNGDGDFYRLRPK